MGVVMSTTEQEEWIEFPCVFPLKVMGLNQDNYPEFVLQVAQKHVAGIDESSIKTKLSKSEKYISVTVTFMAQSRQQLDALYLELNANTLTKMAL